jgi:cation transport protein ChaC
MTLSRRDLEEDRMRSVYVEALSGKHALTDEQLSESLTATLGKRPAGAGWWVFAYGSLLWNPLFPFAESRPGACAWIPSALLPVVARVARPARRARARCSASIAAARVRRRVSVLPGAARDRRAASAVAAARW